MANNIITRFIREEEAASMVEYALVLALVAVVALGGLKLLGPALNTTFTNIAGDI